MLVSCRALKAPSRISIREHDDVVYGRTTKYNITLFTSVF